MAALASPLAAAQFIVEVEPNDTPATAIEVTAPMTLIGTMAGRDQDAYKWRVSDVDAATRWNVELQGIPGRLTILEIARLQYDDAGQVVAVDRLLKMGTRDGALPSTSTGLVFEPGEYLLGLAQDGGGNAAFRPPVASLSFGESGAAPAGVAAPEPGGYRVHVIQGERLGTSGATPLAKEIAAEIRAGREVTTFLDVSSAWYRIEFPDADSRWDVGVQVPVGRTVRAQLTRADGELLSRTTADDRGRLTFSDIAQPAGTYYLEVEPVLERGEAPGFVQTVSVVAVGQRTEGGEAEPNNNWPLATRVDIGSCCTGRLSANNDVDLFAFAVDESRSEQLLEITLATAAGQSVQLCLHSGNGTRIQCRTGAGNVALANLLLPAGDYGIAIERGAAGTEYSISIRTTGVPGRDRETEPNDTLAFASGTPETNRVAGTFDGQGDVDFFKLVIADEPQLWRVQVVGDTLFEVAYHDAAGQQNQRIRAAAGQRRVRLDNLFLLPGIHHVSVSGRAAGDYTLLARALGPPDPNGEIEPNDDESNMQLLRIGQTRTGLLEDPSDRDNYRFYLADWDHIRLVATPPADGALDASLYFNGRPMRQAAQADGAIVLEGVFPPGDYRLQLSAARTSEAEYTLSLARQERFACASDCEPNDSAVFASPVPPWRIVSGRTGDWRDSDWYSLPAAESARDVHLQFERRPAAGITVQDETMAPLAFQWDEAGTAFRGTLPPNRRAFIEIKHSPQSPDYSMSVLVDGESPPALAALPATLALMLEAAEVAAYARSGQRLGGTLELTNGGTTPLALTLDAATSDARWSLVADASVTVPPGSARSVPVTVRVPADAWAEIPVRLSLRATTADGHALQTSADVVARAEASLVNPVHAWDIPEPLRGGLNVARIALGAAADSSPRPAQGSQSPDDLFDGVVGIALGPDFRGRRGGPVTISVDLPGTAPIPIVGFAVNPLSRAYTTWSPRDVRFELSADGASYATVASGALTTVGTDQFFVLDAPIDARAARLVLTTNWAGEHDGNLSLGEWKVIASPGFDPLGSEGIDLADPALGGHVVWAKPTISPNWDASVLTREDERVAVTVAAGEPFEWVVGFHHSRAAQIERIEWRDSSRTETKIDRVIVSASIDSPVGPWEPVAEWVRSESGDALALAAPTWARYLRFSVPPDEQRRTVNPPETLRIRERATSADYRSVLSEWGFASQSAFYESTLPVPPPVVLASRGNESRAAAAPLRPAEPQTGAVVLDRQSHWYRPVVPDGDNVLTLTLTGDPTVRAELVLTDASERQLPLRKRVAESTSAKHVFDAFVPPGTDPYLEVREPPRNVLFLWDSSGSVGAFRPVIYNSLIAYAEDLVPGRDLANFLPFGRSRPLLRDWYGEPYLLQMVLNDYPRRESSSSAERAQYDAARVLAPRAGTKAIVMITDAQTPRFEQMWDLYKEVQPRVFTMKVSSGTSVAASAATEQDLMQDWSRVNGGHYAYLANEGEMEVGFDRVAAMLRKPASYTLTLATESREAPGPGSLRITRAVGTDAAAPAVELILDASGSMLQRMDGRRRIDVAKEVLTTAVTEHIPAGTPTALRVFGHRLPNACETDLEVPLAPLAPLASDALVARIQGIEARNLAKTPIGASLAAVRQDLRGVTGPALVVLVTDGEETCDGDPAAEIARLEQAGIAFTLNIVGFAIDDDVLAAQFEAWAEAGGGRYYAASDPSRLDNAVRQALATSYSVYDAGGNVAGEGVVGGEPIELPQGTYRVEVATTPARVFTDVRISEEAAVAIDL